jgi:hypothetical protein
VSKTRCASRCRPARSSSGRCSFKLRITPWETRNTGFMALYGSALTHDGDDLPLADGHRETVDGVQCVF